MNIITEVAAITTDYDIAMGTLIISSSLVFCVTFGIAKFSEKQTLPLSLSMASISAVVVTALLGLFITFVISGSGIDRDAALKAMESCGYEHIEVSSYGWSAYKDNQKVEGNIDLVGETYLVLGEGKCN